jgi:polyisoprenoid-binding protein YceI
MFLKSKPLYVLATLILLSSLAFSADEYQIDPVHSSATFTVRHMVISNVAGRFGNVTGTIVYDEKNPQNSSVNAVIKTATINTDNTARDNDLKGPNFFDVEKYPDITFKSKKVEKRGDQWVAIGTLTMKDVSKDIELPFDLATLKTARGTRIGVTTETKLNRQDYHLSFNKTLETGGMVVGNDVKIEISIEATPAAPKAAAK